MTHLLDLPSHILLDILTCLPPEDVYTRCAAAQSCAQLLRIASCSGLWTRQQQQQQQQEQHEQQGLVYKYIRRVLSHLLHLPPQAFVVNDDSKRSAKFCITAPMYSLRGLLGVSDVEELAASTARSVQDKIDRVPSWLITHPPPVLSSPPPFLKAQDQGAPGTPQAMATCKLEEVHAEAGPGIVEQSDATEYQQPVLPPHAVMQVCRSDRGTLRLSLNPAAVVKMVLQNQLLDLPLLDLCSSCGPASLLPPHPQLAGPAHSPPETIPIAMWQPYVLDLVSASRRPLAQLLPHAADVVAVPSDVDGQPCSTGLPLSEGVEGSSQLVSHLLRTCRQRSQALLSKRRRGSGAGEHHEERHRAAPLSSTGQQQQQQQQQVTDAAARSAASLSALESDTHALVQARASIRLILLNSLLRGQQAASSPAPEQEQAPSHAAAELDALSAVAMRLAALLDATDRGRGLTPGRHPPPLDRDHTTSARPPAVTVPRTLAAAGVRVQAGAAAGASGSSPGGGGHRLSMSSLERSCRLCLQLRHLLCMWAEVEAHATSSTLCKPCQERGFGGSGPGQQVQAAHQPLEAQPPQHSSRYSTLPPRYACLTRFEVQVAACYASNADSQTCLRCLSLLTESLRLSAGTGGPGPLLDLFEAACTAAAGYCRPVREHSALGLPWGCSEKGDLHLELLGRCLAAGRQQARDGGVLACDEESFARLVLLRSCIQVACWTGWCLGLY